MVLRGRGQSCLPGDIWQHLEALLGVITRGNGIWRIRTRAADMPLTRHETATTTKNKLTPNVNSAEIEQSWSRGAGSRDHFGEGLPVDGIVEPRSESLEEARRSTECEVGPEPPSQP